MARHVYEGMFILDSNRYAKDSAGSVATIPSTVEQLGGEMLASRLWEERRLAYPIKSHRKGTYWLTYFRLDASQVDSLTKQMHLNENVVRSLFIKIDPRIADAMVEHALTGGGPMAEQKAKAAQDEAAEAETEEETTEEGGEQTDEMNAGEDKD